MSYPHFGVCHLPSFSWELGGGVCVHELEARRLLSPKRKEPAIQSTLDISCPPCPYSHCTRPILPPEHSCNLFPLHRKPPPWPRPPSALTWTVEASHSPPSLLPPSPPPIHCKRERADSRRALKVGLTAFVTNGQMNIFSFCHHQCASLFYLGLILFLFR